MVSKVWQFFQNFCIVYWICGLRKKFKIFQIFWSPSDEILPKMKFTVHDTCELKLWFNLLIGKTLRFHPFEGEEEERDESSTIMHKWTIPRWNYSKFVSLQFWTQCIYLHNPSSSLPSSDPFSISSPEILSLATNLADRIPAPWN